MRIPNEDRGGRRDRGRGDMREQREASWEGPSHYVAECVFTCRMVRTLCVCVVCCDQVIHIQVHTICIHVVTNVCVVLSLPTTNLTTLLNVECQRYGRPRAAPRTVAEPHIARNTIRWEWV